MNDHIRRKILAVNWFSTFSVSWESHAIKLVDPKLY